MALQPHPRARPRSLHPRHRHDHRRARRPRPGDRAPRRGRPPPRLGDLPEHADALGGCTTRWRSTRSSSTCPAGVTVADPIVVRHTGPADGVAAAPHLVVASVRRSEVARRRAVRRRRGRAAAPGHHGPSPSAARRRATSASSDSTAAAWSVGTLDVDAAAGGQRHGRRWPGFGGDYARLRTDCRLVRPGRLGQPPGRLLRRRRPDPRLPHLPGARRAGHHEQPAVQGRGQRPVAVRVHRAHPGRRRRPAAPTPSRPTATSSSPRTPGPSRSRTSRSRTTTCTAATRRPSARSTRSSASTSRAAACPPASPSG